MWRDSMKLSPTVAQDVAQNKTTMSKGTNMTDYDNISNDIGMSTFVNQNESTAENFVSAIGDRSQQGDSRVTSTAVSNALRNLCIQTAYA